MSQKTPFISIVLPTRDRPEMVELSLACLSRQSFSDFEVIVVDNYIDSSCRDKFLPYQSDERFHYYTPETALPMADNWEFAITKARGEYVAVISEKYLFRHDALQIVFDNVNRYPAPERPEVITWWHETFTLQSTAGNLLAGRYAPLNKPQAPVEYQGLDELRRRMSFAKRPYSRQVGVKECLGKIYSGCFHRDLLSQIKIKFGRIFQPTMPDITSMTAAMSFNPKCVDLGQPLILVCASPEISNGFQTLTNSEKFKAFYADVDANKYQLGELPLPELSLSLNNLIAHDFCYFQSLSDNPDFAAITLNKVNLLVCAFWDFEKIQTWQSPEEKQMCYQAWQQQVNSLDALDQQQVEIAIEQADFNQPCPQEIFFAGGTDVGVIEQTLTATERARLNWRDDKVFKVNESDLLFDDVNSAMQYFTEYYQASAGFLRLL